MDVYGRVGLDEAANMKVETPTGMNDFSSPLGLPAIFTFAVFNGRKSKQKEGFVMAEAGATALSE